MCEVGWETDFLDCKTLDELIKREIDRKKLKGGTRKFAGFALDSSIEREYGEQEQLVKSLKNPAGVRIGFGDFCFRVFAAYSCPI